jgi:hypothetical protein
VIEPRKEGEEADAIRNAEGNIDRRATVGRLDRGHRAGHVHVGFPRKLGDLIDADIGRYS